MQTFMYCILGLEFLPFLGTSKLRASSRYLMKIEYSDRAQTSTWTTYQN